MSAETRQRILASAVELFARAGGQHGVTLRDIAADCDVLLGTIFYHFPQKGLLYQAAVAQAYEQRAVQIEASLAGPEPAAFRLRRFVKDMLDRYDSDDPFMLLVDWNAHRKDATDVSQAVRDTFNENYVHMARVIAEISGEPSDRTQVDSRVAYLFSLISGFSKLYREYGAVLKLKRDGGADAIADDMAAFMIQAIKSGKAG